jgi:hypothetical protein
MKVVLGLIAISVASALTGGFLTKRAIKDVMRRAEEHAYRLLRRIEPRHAYFCFAKLLGAPSMMPCDECH